MDPIAVGVALSAVQKTDPDWIDLTDGGYTGLHKHIVAKSDVRNPRTFIQQIGHPGGPWSSASPFFCNSLATCPFNPDTYPTIEVWGYTFRSSDLDQIKLSYLAVDHIGTLASPGDFTFTPTTHDFGDGDGPVPVTRWAITLTTDPTEGSDDVDVEAKSLDGITETDSRAVVVDNTQPLISGGWVEDSPTHRDYATQGNLYKGEYVKCQYVASDTNYDYTRIYSGAMTTTVDFNRPETSYITAWLRSKNVTGSQTINLRAVDKAGNYNQISLTPLTVQNGPALPALVGFDYVDAGTPIPPQTMYYQNLAGSSYADNVARFAAQIASALIGCRNSGNSDRVARFQSGTLSLTTMVATTADWTNFVATGVPISTQASRNDGKAVFHIEDQFWSTQDWSTTRNAWYNNHKALDYSSDPNIVTAYIGFPFNKAGFDAFADGVNVASLAGCRVFDGTINNQASTGSVEVTIDIGENTHKTHQIRLSRRDTQSEVDWAGWGSKLKAKWWNGSAWVYCNNDQLPATPSFGSGSQFSIPTVQTSIRIKLEWSATIPDIEVLACLYIK
jgi:hypothetical protein